MTTNQIMVRKMGQFDILQRTKDGFFNATYLAEQWRKCNNHKDKRVEDYLSKLDTQVLIDEIIKSEIESSMGDTSGKSDYQPVSISRVKDSSFNGRKKKIVYMNPYLFLDFAMWLNPEFKLQVLKFCSDRMLDFRNEAGDAYKRLSASVQKLIENDQSLNMRKCMEKVAEALNWIVFNSHESEMRNQHGDEKKMEELFRLEQKLSDLIEDDFITTYDSLITYMRAQYVKKRTPQCFK